jgi:hypothetical protein
MRMSKLYRRQIEGIGLEIGEVWLNPTNPTNPTGNPAPALALVNLCRHDC